MLRAVLLLFLSLLLLARVRILRFLWRRRSGLRRRRNRQIKVLRFDPPEEPNPLREDVIPLDVAGGGHVTGEEGEVEGGGEGAAVWINDEYSAGCT